MHVLPDWVAVTTETLTHNVPVTMEKIRSSERYNHEHSMMEKCGYTLKYSWTLFLSLLFYRWLTFSSLPLVDHIFEFALSLPVFRLTHLSDFVSLLVHSPFWVCWSAGDWFTDADFVEDSVHQVDQPHTEWGKQIKQLAHKMTTCS